ncbi:DsbA family protein [Candidatus Peregrinibacteria bacterium]|jgi:protein-disulfide isomerase|nr:DsbA family protein [Candidatus Peregrinibacteria bacterium]MBT3598562.1 DsbA family protein [Candidatus Peregrinibacteria bacterium]MBT4367409.1 DsbA family protein [Candidatus Peregrinibacteria bacterium]MBT4585289.1 DsbA family protein [Candidatus Peregrinibacteria bacterium]MBT6730557.1 DsbA family protein [Candidatus Peregrinibacteria bacterium]
MRYQLALILSVLFLVSCDGGPTPQSSRGPKGNPNAAVVLSEFSDIQCPACKSIHFRVVKPIIDKYGNDIALNFKHFPLMSIHRFALEASEASECAADQGKFWEFIDIAYENQESLNSSALIEWGESLNLDMDLYKSCLKSGGKKDIVLSDYQEGRDLNVRGTPTFYVNGKQVQTGFDTLGDAIDAELERLTQNL